MKKKLLFVALALASTGLFAQKQTGGEKNIEVQFSPLNASPISTNGIRLRLFNSESSAIRIGFGIGGGTTTTVNTQPFEATSSSGTDVPVDALYDYDRNFSFNIRPGYEMHFEGTDRLSPYVGAELLIGINRNSFEREFWGPNSQISVDNQQRENFEMFTMKRNEGSTVIGFGAVAGVDYYIADNLYLGAEIGFGFNRTVLRDVEVEVSDENYYIFTNDNADVLGGYVADFGDFNDVATVVDGTNNTRILENRTIVGDNSGDWKDFQWGVTFQPTIRLGWLFN